MKGHGLTVAFLAGFTAFAAESGPLHDAIKAGELAAAEALISQENYINDIDFLAGSPLHVAATVGQADIASRLIAAGAEIDIREFGMNETPLHRAATFGRTEVLRILLAAGADTDARNDRQKTPLIKALEAGHEQSSIELIEAGADIFALTQNGESPLELAGRNQLKNVVALLRQRGAAPPEPEDIKPLISKGDIKRGRSLYIASYCHRCHSGGGESDNIVAPNLWNIVGRDIASVEGYEYSSALQEAEGRWDYDNLNRFLKDPSGFFPGTTMGLWQVAGSVGVEDAQDRADLIAFLRTQAKDPWPLP